MEINMMRGRCRVLRTASDDVYNPFHMKRVPWETYGYTLGDIVQFTIFADGSDHAKCHLGWFEDPRPDTGGGRVYIVHGEAEVLRV